MDISSRCSISDSIVVMELAGGEVVEELMDEVVEVVVVKVLVIVLV